MSGLAESHGAGIIAAVVNPGNLVQQRDIDQYLQYEVYKPSVDTAYIGTVSSATALALVVFKSFTPDYPRNFAYSVTGVAGGMGGTFDMQGFDQFGSPQHEKVVIGSAAGGGTTNGTRIWGSCTAATVSPIGLAGTAVGTFAIGFSTTTSVTGNWFGLPVKIAGTTDFRGITWNNNGTSTALNKGTGLGTLVSAGQASTPPHAFQGTSGVAITDSYVVTIKTTFENAYGGVMTAL